MSSFTVWEIEFCHSPSLTCLGIRVKTHFPIDELDKANNKPTPSSSNLNFRFLFKTKINKLRKMCVEFPEYLIWGTISSSHGIDVIQLLDSFHLYFTPQKSRLWFISRDWKHQPSGCFKAGRYSGSENEGPSSSIMRKEGERGGQRRSQRLYGPLRRKGCWINLDVKSEARWAHSSVN